MAATNNLLTRLNLDDSQFRNKLKGVHQQTSGLQQQFSQLGGIIAGAFAITGIVAFTKQAVELAGKAEGVREAFKRLNDDTLLNDLRRATSQTVSDLQLMQYAVRAQNFKIPLSQLAIYFEFATKRAAQTGEAVDYLVNSIITGIGRKSVLVMDNLGISASELQEEVKKVGDFGVAAGNIIGRELGNMGDVTVTTTQKFEALNAQLDNFKVAFGGMVIDIGIGTFFENLADKIDGFSQSLEDLKGIMDSGRGTAFGNFIMDIFGYKAGGFSGGVKSFPVGDLVDPLEEIKQKTYDIITGFELWANATGTLTTSLEQFNTTAKQSAKAIAEVENARRTRFEDNPMERDTGGAGGGGGLGGLIGAQDWGQALDVEGFGEATAAMETRWLDFTFTIQEQAMAMQSVLQVAFSGIVDALFSLADGSKTFGEAMEDLLRNLLRTILNIIAAKFAEAVASSIASGAQKGGAIGGFAEGAAMAAGFGAMIPAFAEGGLIYGPTLGLMGEYAGASSNPEVIAPLNKLQSMMGGNKVEVFGVLRGEDIYLTNKKQASKYSRY